jgi:hypothetical protein
MVQVTRRKPCITEWRSDDLNIAAEFTIGRGERVEASFTHVGFLVPPVKHLKPFAVQQRTGYLSIFCPVRPGYEARRRALLGLSTEPMPEDDPELWLHHPGGAPQRPGREPIRVKVSTRQPEVLAWETDDEFITIPYRYPGGQRVTGLFRLLAWRRPPAKVLEQFYRAQSRGYVAWCRPSRPMVKPAGVPAVANAPQGPMALLAPLQDGVS